MGNPGEHSPWKRGAEAYLELYSKLRHAPASQEQVRAVASRFEEYIGDRPITDIDVADIEGYLVWRKSCAGLQNASLNTELARLQAIFSWFKKRKYVNENPAREVERLPVADRTLSSLPDDEKLRELLTYLNNRAGKAPACALLHDIAKLILNLGLRVGEVLRLTKADVDLRRKVIKITNRMGRTKTLKEDTLPIPDAIYDMIARRYLAANPLLFGRPDGKPYTRHYITRAFKRHSTRAGIGDVTLRLFRHVPITKWAEMYPERVTQKLSRHRSGPVMLSKYYVHASALKLPKPPDII